MNRISLAVCTVSLLMACGKKNLSETPPAEVEAPAPEAAAPAPEPEPEAPTSSATAAADVPWAPVNPEQPEGPSWVILEGDPSKGAFTMMAKLGAGFETPLHKHPAGFTGVVISGEVRHGASKDAAKAMGPGTMWTEPADEAHVTACVGEEDCVFVGRMDGPMAMTPVDAPSETAKATVVPAAEIAYQPVNPEQPQGPGMALLSGDQTQGAFVALARFPGGMITPEHVHTAGYVGVVIAGQIKDGEGAAKTAGSYWNNAAQHPHETSCVEGQDCVFFVSMDGAMDMTPTAAPPAEGAEAAPAAAPEGAGGE